MRNQREPRDGKEVTSEPGMDFVINVFAIGVVEDMDSSLASLFNFCQLNSVS